MVYDIIVVGGGIAGMTAGIYARRAGKTVLIFESSNFGGQIINAESIKNYPAESGISGYDLASKVYNQTIELGAQFKFEKVLQIKKTENLFKIKSKSAEYSSKTVIIATGSKNKLLGIEGESKFIGKGVSYCATCDGAFFKNKTVVVVGGGNAAFEDALYLCDLAKMVYLVCDEKNIKAEQMIVNLVCKKRNFKQVNGKILEINGENRVESIKFQADGETKVLNVDGVFVAIGRTPDNAIFSELVDLDKFGYIVSGENCKTKTEGLFVAGDCKAKIVRQLVTAASDGAIASVMANKYLIDKK